MKVLLVAERYWPEVGAAPSRLANMAEGLKAKGCEVDVLTSLPNYPQGKIFDGYRGRVSKQEVHNGVDLFRYWIYATVSRNPVARGLNMFSFAFMIWLFAFKCRRIKGYDRIIIQTPTLVVAASAMAIFKKIYHKKCILNVSDIWPLTAVDMGAMKEGGRSFDFMVKLECFLYRNADGVLGQSQEILDHVAEYPNMNHLFLYRNLQKYQIDFEYKQKSDPFKVVFSGMLGVAQDVSGIVKNVPFKEMGVEFHILGGGKQYDEICEYVKEHPGCNVFAHGFVPKEEIAGRLREMNATIIPLVTRIRGAVPSKLFDILPQGIPIVYSGGGEGARFVEERKLGLSCSPGNYQELKDCLLRLRNMDSAEYEAMSARCIKVSRDELDFDKQLSDCVEYLKHI